MMGNREQRLGTDLKDPVLVWIRESLVDFAF